MYITLMLQLVTEELIYYYIHCEFHQEINYLYP